MLRNHFLGITEECYLLRSPPPVSTPVSTHRWEREHFAMKSRALWTRKAKVSPSQSSVTSFQCSNAELYLVSACCTARRKHRESPNIHRSSIKTSRGHAEMKEDQIEPVWLQLLIKCLIAVDTCITDHCSQPLTYKWNCGESLGPRSQDWRESCVTTSWTKNK